MYYVSVPNKVGALHRLVNAHYGLNVLKQELQSLAVIFNALEVDC